MMIPRIALLSLLPALLLTACASRPPAQANLAYYDLSGEPASLPAPLRSVDITSSSWLASNAMYYRLAYADGNRREHYAESRWTAQPAELLGVRLERNLMGAVATPGSFLCRLRLELDDLTQVFDQPGSSRLLLEARATLYGTQQTVLARRSLSLSRPAGADARSGVAASGAVVDALSRDLQAWARQECRKAP
ncbi:MAG: PqiC family protein [Rhodocyclaceae bacterium]|jgi:cholesterol transport system auxiliary component|nr:PqiC family protein [Rhodocyclaceae bacterium]